MDRDYARTNDYSNNQEEMIPFFSVSSRDFDRDLIVLKKY